MPHAGACSHCSHAAMDNKWLKNKAGWVYNLLKFHLVKARLYGTEAEVREAELAILQADFRRGPNCLAGEDVECILKLGIEDLAHHLQKSFDRIGKDLRNRPLENFIEFDLQSVANAMSCNPVKLAQKVLLRTFAHDLATHSVARQRVNLAGAILGGALEGQSAATGLVAMLVDKVSREKRGKHKRPCRLSSTFCSAEAVEMGA